jgi:uncharacterized surface protein with fasciclin (FAS1) repeats
MKNFKINSSYFLMALLVSFALFTTSCSKDEAAAPSTPESPDYKKGNSNGAPAPGDMTIVDIALGFAFPQPPAEAEFTQLVAALLYVDAEIEDANLVETLSGNAQYTVFAPTDEAFENLYAALTTPENPVDEISDLPAGLVKTVLEYHLTNGRRATNSVVPKNPNSSRQIMTLLGETFSVDSDRVITAIGNTAVIDEELNNISASNGIIHVINAVILPIQ